MLQNKLKTQKATFLVTESVFKNPSDLIQGVISHPGDCSDAECMDVKSNSLRSKNSVFLLFPTRRLFKKTRFLSLGCWVCLQD